MLSIRRTSLLVAMFMAIAPFAAHAETLDDETIRALYAQVADAIGDGEKTRAYMVDRLDDKFILKINQTVTVNNGPPQTSQKVENKTEAIMDSVKGYEAMKIADYKYDITQIQYSPDKKTAYVNSSQAATGTINVPVNGGVMPAQFTDGESCLDMIMLIDNKIKTLQSACNDKLTLTKQ